MIVASILTVITIHILCLNEVIILILCRTRLGSTPRLDMTVAEFADWWAKHKAGADDGRLLYLKDWHYAAEFPDYKAYETPAYFQQDWLNDYFDMRRERQCSKGIRLHSDTFTDSRLQRDKLTESSPATNSTADGDAHCSQTRQVTQSDKRHQIGIRTDSRRQKHAVTDSNAAADSTADGVADIIQMSQLSMQSDREHQTDSCTDSMLEEEHRHDSLTDRSDESQLASAHPASKTDEDDAGVHSESARGPESSDVECSDYRFVYLGCKVRLAIYHQLP